MINTANIYIYIYKLSRSISDFKEVGGALK